MTWYVSDRDAVAPISSPVLRRETLSGGDLSQVEKLTLADGRQVIAKTGPFPRREADMLRALAAAGALVPEVLDADDHHLILSVVADQPLDWRRLGEVLAQLHATQGPAYGWPEDYAFGPVIIPNTWNPDWPGFWADNRLRPFVPHLPMSAGQRLETVCDDLRNRLPASPTPSLLHGDLWTGNVMGATLIDPACYYGHAEVDLAMLNLFGQPPAAFYDIYKPDPDWLDRQPIYTLWPALVHFRLFGNAYLPMVERLLDA